MSSAPVDKTPRFYNITFPDDTQLSSGKNFEDIHVRKKLRVTGDTYLNGDVYVRENETIYSDNIEATNVKTTNLIADSISYEVSNVDNLTATNITATNLTAGVTSFTEPVTMSSLTVNKRTISNSFYNMYDINTGTPTYVARIYTGGNATWYDATNNVYNDTAHIFQIKRAGANYTAFSFGTKCNMALNLDFVASDINLRRILNLHLLSMTDTGGGNWVFEQSTNGNHLNIKRISPGVDKTLMSLNANGNGLDIQTNLNMTSPQSKIDQTFIISDGLTTQNILQKSSIRINNVPSGGGPLTALEVLDSSYGLKMLFLPNVSSSSFGPFQQANDTTIMSAGVQNGSKLCLSTWTSHNLGIRIASTSSTSGTITMVSGGSTIQINQDATIIVGTLQMANGQISIGGLNNLSFSNSSTIIQTGTGTNTLKSTSITGDLNIDRLRFTQQSGNPIYSTTIPQNLKFTSGIDRNITNGITLNTTGYYIFYWSIGLIAKNHQCVITAISCNLSASDVSQTLTVIPIQSYNDLALNPGYYHYMTQSQPLYVIGGGFMTLRAKVVYNTTSNGEVEVVPSPSSEFYCLRVA